MEKKQTVSGFTLLELLVSMALTTMVFFIGQYIFSAFKDFTLTYDSALDYTYDLGILQHQIDRDLQATKKWKYEEELDSWCMKYAHDEIGPCYAFESGEIIRIWQESRVSWEFQGELRIQDSLQQWVLIDTVHKLSMRFSLPKEGRVKP